MTFNRTLSQLADEYFEQAQVLDRDHSKEKKTAFGSDESRDERRGI